MADNVHVNLIQLNADLAAFAERIDADLVAVIKKVALSLYAKVTERTPVDTGRARANWNISLGSPNLNTTPAGTHSDYQNDPTDAVLQKGQLMLANMKEPGDVWISNGLPYIQKLNEGHSQQAPSAFVEAVVAEVEAEIDAL